MKSGNNNKELVLSKTMRKYIRNKYRDSELKNYDGELYNYSVSVNTFASSACPPSGETSLTGVTKGDGATDCIGRRYLMKSLHLRGVMRYQPTATEAQQRRSRLIVFIDTQTNGSPSGSLASLLSEPTNSQNYVNAYQDLGFSYRYKVLADRYFTFRPAANINTTEMSDAALHFEFNFDLEDRCMEVELLSDGAGEASNYSIVIGAVCTGGDIRLDYVSRFRFYG
jgi:hypothetical protein